MSLLKKTGTGGLTMPEYIEREATLYRMKVDIAPPFKVVAEMPSAEVAPVRHGRWVYNGIPDSILSGCSLCGFSCGVYSFNVCPNCGAKMDLEVANGTE